MKSERIIADIVLKVSTETPLCHLLSKLVGKMVTLYDFVYIYKGEDIATLKHLDSDLIISYTLKK